MLSEVKLKIRLRNTLFIASKKENPYWRAFYASGYGVIDNDSLVLHPVEVLYLIENGKGMLLINDDKISLEDAYRLISRRIRDILRLYLVYRDIRERGYIIRPLHSDLTPFEIYERGKNHLQDESFALILVAEAGKEIRLEELSQALKQAKRYNKLLIVALIDEIGEITYYQIDETLVEETILKIYRK